MLLHFFILPRRIQNRINLHPDPQACLEELDDPLPGLLRQRDAELGLLGGGGDHGDVAGSHHRVDP